MGLVKSKKKSCDEPGEPGNTPVRKGIGGTVEGGTDSKSFEGKCRRGPLG